MKNMLLRGRNAVWSEFGTNKYVLLKNCLPVFKLFLELYSLNLKFNYSKKATKLKKIVAFSEYIKVSKSQKHFFLKLHCQKTNEIFDKILP